MNLYSREIKEYFEPGKKNIIFIYILLLAGTIHVLFSIIGALLLFISKSRVNFLSQIRYPDHYLSHYIFAIRTFGVGLTGLLFSLIIIAPISHILSIIIFVWATTRSIIAIQFLLTDLPHPNPLTFAIK